VFYSHGDLHGDGVCDERRHDPLLPKTAKIEQTLPATPIVLQSPLDGAFVWSLFPFFAPIFGWTSRENCKGYEVHFSLDQDLARR